MATGTIFNPFITEDHQLTPASSKIDDGVVHAKRVGNFLVLSGWFHTSSEGTNGEVLYNWPTGLAPAASGNALVASNTSGVRAVQYTTTSIIVYRTIESSWWNFPTTAIPII